MRKFRLKIGLQDYKDPDRKVWMTAGLATQMDDNDTILCTLTLIPVSGWDGQFKLFPVDEDEKSTR